MSLLRRTFVAAPAALGLFISGALPAGALPPERAPLARTLFAWNGTVDREVVLVIRGRNVETRASGLDASFAPRLEVREGLPRQGGDLDVQLAQGRGEVEVLQRPSARNDYTGMVRIVDPRGGRDNYRVIVSFAPAGDDTWNGNGNDGRDRNGDWDNDRNRNGNNGNGNANGNRNGNNGNGNGNANGNRGRGNDGWDSGFPGGGNGRNRNGSNMIAWQGDVDDVVDIRIQGNRVEYRTRSGAPIRNVQFDANRNGLPRRAVTVEPDVVRGRGDVTVIQQPTARNGYTAVIRVEDRSGGYGRYDFDLRWY